MVSDPRVGLLDGGFFFGGWQAGNKTKGAGGRRLGSVAVFSGGRELIPTLRPGTSTANQCMRPEQDRFLAGYNVFSPPSVRTQQPDQRGG